jgi:hypothetical protein
MWKVIYVTSQGTQVARVARALEAAGLLCQIRQVGTGGTAEIMVSASEVEEAQAVLARTMREPGREP